MRKRTPNKKSSSDDGGEQRLSIPITVHRDRDPYKGKTKTRNYNISRFKEKK